MADYRRTVLRRPLKNLNNLIRSLLLSHSDIISRFYVIT